MLTPSIDYTLVASMGRSLGSYRSRGPSYPSDLALLIAASNGTIGSLVGPPLQFSAAAGQVAKGDGTVGDSQVIANLIHADGYYSAPAYTNALPDPIVFVESAVTKVGELITESATDALHRVYALNAGAALVDGSVYVEAKASGRRYVQLTSETGFVTFDLTAGVVSYEGGGGNGNITALSDGWFACHASGMAGSQYVSICLQLIGTANYRLPSYAGDGVSGIRVRNVMHTAGDYQFVPIPGGQSTVSTVGTTTGNGLSVELDTSITDCLSGVNTVAARITCGASSAEITAPHNILTVNDVAAGLLYLDASGTLKSTDGTNTATVSIAGGFARGDALLCFEQANSAGTQFRVGYEKNGAGTITWGSWATFDGSFNPGTYLRANLNNAAPSRVSGFDVSSLSLDDAHCLIMGDYIGG